METISRQCGERTLGSDDLSPAGGVAHKESAQQVATSARQFGHHLEYRVSTRELIAKIIDCTNFTCRHLSQGKRWLIEGEGFIIRKTSHPLPRVLCWCAQELENLMKQTIRIRQCEEKSPTRLI